MDRDTEKPRWRERHRETERRREPSYFPLHVCLRAANRLTVKKAGKCRLISVSAGKCRQHLVTEGKCRLCESSEEKCRLCPWLCVDQSQRLAVGTGRPAGWGHRKYHRMNITQCADVCRTCPSRLKKFSLSMEYDL